MQISGNKFPAGSRKLGMWLLPVLLSLLSTSCSYDQFLMFRIFQKYHTQIRSVTKKSSIDPAFLAALISLESDPAGNEKSQRFESGVYERLLALKYEGRRFGGIQRKVLVHLDDQELIRYATSYGLIQIMGYHCIQLGCKIEDLTGPDQLKWAVRYMNLHYGNHARKKDWATCFRIHNTGHPNGETPRKDYVERGLTRMKLYREWETREK